MPRDDVGEAFIGSEALGILEETTGVSVSEGEREAIERIVSEAIEVQYNTEERADEVDSYFDSVRRKIDERQSNLYDIWDSLPKPKRELSHFQARYDRLDDILGVRSQSLDEISDSLDEVRRQIAEGDAEQVEALERFDKIERRLELVEYLLDARSDDVEEFEQWATQPSARLDAHRGELGEFEEQVERAAAVIETQYQAVEAPEPQKFQEYKERSEDAEKQLETAQEKSRNLKSELEAEAIWVNQQSESDSEYVSQFKQIQNEYQSISDRLEEITRDYEFTTERLSDPRWHATRLEAWMEEIQTQNNQIRDNVNNSRIGQRLDDEVSSNLEKLSESLSLAEEEVSEFVVIARASHGEASLSTARSIDETLTDVESIIADIHENFDNLNTDGVSLTTSSTSAVAAGAPSAGYSDADAAESLSDKVPGRVKVGPNEAYAQHISQVEVDLGTVLEIASVAAGTSLAPDPVFASSVVMSILASMYRESKVDIREEDGFICWVAHETGASDHPVSVEDLRDNVDSKRDEIEIEVVTDDISVDDSIRRLERVGVVDLYDRDEKTRVELSMHVSSSWE